MHAYGTERNEEERRSAMLEATRAMERLYLTHTEKDTYGIRH